MQANIIISEDILDWVISRVSPGALSSKLWELLCAWKDGVKVPTYNQIEKISKASGIPLGYFFLKTPPVEDTSFVEYRTVDSAELSNPSRNLIDTMHDMEIIQDWLRNELSIIGDNNLQFVGAIDNRVNQKIFADYVRELLQIEINWYEQNHTAEENFRLLRNQISTIGVMVMMSGIVGSNTHRPLDTNEFRAFALVDEKAPLIFINSNDSINGSEWVFPSPTGGPMSPDSVLHMLQRVLKRAALPRIRFHDLRHTFATMALQNGVDVKTVSSMLGHYSAGFTLDTYAHVTTDAQLKAAQTMGNILSRAV